MNTLGTVMADMMVLMVDQFGQFAGLDEQDDLWESCGGF